MRALKNMLLGCLGVAAALAPARAAVLIPIVPAPNSTATVVFGINDNNTIAGGYVGTDGLERAFFGSLDGTYTSFSVGTGGSEARAINDNGYIVGFSNSQHGTTATQPIFERRPSGKVLNVTVNGQQLFGRAQGINNSENRFAGTYWDFGSHESVAFAGHHGRYRRDIRIPLVHQASDGEGIDSTNVTVGDFFQPPTHGFIKSGNTLTVVDYPGSNVDGTSLKAINDNGQAVGQWSDTDGNTHSFVLDIASNAFTDINVSGATRIEAWNINAAGAVAVNTDVGSFIWCARKRACPAGGATVAVPVHRAGRFPHYSCKSPCTSLPARRD